MKWLSIKTNQPLHGQKIIGYCPKFTPRCLKDGYLYVFTWDEKENCAMSEYGAIEITAWIPCPILPKE